MYVAYESKIPAQNYLMPMHPVNRPPSQRYPSYPANHPADIRIEMLSRSNYKENESQNIRPIERYTQIPHTHRVEVIENKRPVAGHVRTQSDYQVGSISLTTSRVQPSNHHLEIDTLKSYTHFSGSKQSSQQGQTVKEFFEDDNVDSLEDVKRELAALRHKVLKNQEKFGKLEERYVKQPFKGLTEVNEIAKLVEESKKNHFKSQEEQRKMIEGFRETILGFRQEITQIKRQQNDDSVGNIIREREFTQRIHHQNSEVAQRMHNQISQLRIKFEKLTHDLQHQLSTGLETLKSQFKQFSSQKKNRYRSSTKLFEGKMVSFCYEERLLTEDENSVACFKVLENESTKIVGPNKMTYHRRTTSSNECNNITVTKKSYHLDCQGYLLDERQYYLIDHHGKQVRLSQAQLSILKQYGLLQ